MSVQKKQDPGSSVGSKTGVTSSSEIECDNTGNSANKKKVTFSMKVSTPASPSVSDVSTPNDKNEANVSARAQRSLRRQAKIETIAAKAVSQRPSTSTNNSKRVRRYTGAATSSKSKKKGKAADNEEVIKIKLNTGTLYMYKGLNRRVSFVRRL